MVINLYDELYYKIEENSLGKRLKKSRLNLKLSQEQFAIKCGLSRGAIEGYEKDWIHPSREALLKIGNLIDLNYICIDTYSKFLLSNYISKFKGFRLKNKLSMRSMARLLGIASSTYNAWESNLYNISKDNYYKIEPKLKELGII